MISRQRTIGIALLIIGIAVLWLDARTSVAAAGQMGTMIASSTTTSAMAWYTFWGVALGLLGLLMSVVSTGKK